VPSVAGAVSILILVFALARDGVTPISYSQSVVYVNEKTRTQVQLSTLTVMAPVGLRSPLHFGSSVEVMPAPASQEFSSGRRTVRNEGDLILGSGWVPSRVPVTFLLRDTGALAVPVLAFEKQGEGVTVTNPYDVAIRSLRYCDAEGVCLVLDGALAPGETTVLMEGERPREPLSGAAHGDVRPPIKDMFFGAKAIGMPMNVPMSPNTYLLELGGSPFMAHPIRRGKVRHEGKTLVLGELQ